MASDFDDFRITPAPAPQSSPETLLHVHNMGHDAGFAGHPPVPPSQWSLYLKAWMEGWQAGADLRNRPDGWSSLNIDHEWKGR